MDSSYALLKHIIDLPHDPPSLLHGRGDHGLSFGLANFLAN